jgi:hypothetical protein
MDRAHSDQIEDAPQLERMYRTIPAWKELLAAVRAGRREFEGLLAKAGLLGEDGPSTSAVHSYQGVELHAFILGIVSAGRWEEVQTKSFLTYASHWIDDFFDSPAKVVNARQMLADRHDIRRALANMGRAGQIGFAMAGHARHPAAVFKALHRMLYGGLVQRAKEYERRRALVGEYLDVAMQFVDPWLIAEIRSLQPEAYWTTNKTVLELLNAAEPNLDFTASELWNLVYAPALYYEDAKEERACGELSFEEHDAPRLPEMLRMVRLGAKYLARALLSGSSRALQLRFAARTLPNLPDEIAIEYRALWEERMMPL